VHLALYGERPGTLSPPSSSGSGGSGSDGSGGLDGGAVVSHAASLERILARLERLRTLCDRASREPVEQRIAARARKAARRGDDSETDEDGCPSGSESESASDDTSSVVDHPSGPGLPVRLNIAPSGV